MVNPNHISVTFDTIGGLENIKQALVRSVGVPASVPRLLTPCRVQHDLVILPLVRPELFARGKLLTPTKGVLLYGPPGTGKTMIAKALAKESGACFLNVRSAALQSKWFGDAQKLVTAVFTLAWKIQPCVIFIDEIDSFLGSRKSSEHEAVTSMKTEFMALWDGFLTDNNARVLVLAATNRPWDIDEAILRRLPRAFEVPLPDAAQRKRILSVLLRGEDVDETLWADRDGDLDRLAQATGGYSGSDLQDLCKQAAMLPIHDLLEEERAASAAGAPDTAMPREPRPLTAEDLFAVLEVRPHSSWPWLAQRSSHIVSHPPHFAHRAPPLPPPRLLPHTTAPSWWSAPCGTQPPWLGRPPPAPGAVVCRSPRRRRWAPTWTWRRSCRPYWPCHKQLVWTATAAPRRGRQAGRLRGAAQLGPACPAGGDQLGAVAAARQGLLPRVVLLVTAAHGMMRNE